MGVGTIENPTTSGSPPRKRRRPAENLSIPFSFLQESTFIHYFSIKSFAEQTELHSPGQYLNTPTFGNDDYKIVMKVYPNGRSRKTKGYVSILLEILNCSREKVKLPIQFSIETSDGAKNACPLTPRIKTEENDIWVSAKSHSVEEIKRNSDLCTPNNVLTIRCKVTVYESKFIEVSENFNKDIRGFKAAMTSFSSSSTSGFSISPSKRSRSLSESSSNKEDLNDDERQNESLELVSNGNNADFCIVSNGCSKFKLHRDILSAHSDYFKNIFRDPSCVEYKAETSLFSEYNSQTLEAVLQYIYGPANTPIDIEKLPEEFARVVARLKIPSIRDRMAKKIFVNVTPENVVKRIRMAIPLQLKMDALIEFFANRQRDVMNSKGWKEMKEERPQTAVKLLEKVVRTSEQPDVSNDRHVV